MPNSTSIENWMEAFKTAWLAKDIAAVFELLSEDVEYWETPFEKLGKGKELWSYWEEILPLQNLRLDYDIFVADTESGRYGVRWEFAHDDGEAAGCYLIELDGRGKCTYFFHSAQPRE